MSPLVQQNCYTDPRVPRDYYIQLGERAICDVKKIVTADAFPTDIYPEAVMSLQLPNIEFTDYDEIGAKELFLCYAPQRDFLFVVETEMRRRNREFYRAQYGANDNYDKVTVVRRTAWIYTVDAPRAKEPEIADRLRCYLPQKCAGNPPPSPA